MNDPQYVGGMKSGVPGFTTQDQQKIRSDVQADDHNQPHKNWMESMRSVFERSLTISRDGTFDENNTSTVQTGSWLPVDVDDTRDEEGLLYRGPPASEPLWDPINFRVKGLIESAFYFITLDFNYNPSSASGEIALRLRDDVTSDIIAFAPAIEAVKFGAVFFHTQLNFAFLTPNTGITGNRYVLEGRTAGTSVDMAERSITIHRER